MATSLEIVNDAITGATANIVWGLPGSGKLNTLLEQVLLVAPTVPVIFCTNEVPPGQIRQRIGKDVPFEIVEVNSAKDILDCIARAPKGSWIFVDSVTNLVALHNVLSMVVIDLARAAQAQGVILWMSAQKRAECNPVNAPISGMAIDTP